MQKTFNMRQEGDNFMALRHLRHNNTEFYLISCGIEQCLEKHSYGPGKRDKFLIHFILSGKGYFLIDGVLPPSVLHTSLQRLYKMGLLLLKA